MQFFQVNDPANNKMIFVCDSQATIDAAPQAAKDKCIIGTEDDAKTLLEINRAAFLEASRDLFTTNLQTHVDEGVRWTIIDLNAEEQNSDKEYFVLNPITGLHKEAIGLDAAKNALKEAQNSFCIHYAVDHYYIETEWPTNEEPEIPPHALPPPEQPPLPPPPGWGEK